MKRIFITGMSGTGKSSVIEALRSREFAAIDTDYDDWCELSVLDDDTEWIWRKDRMQDLLTMPLASSLFVSGCCSNQRNFYEYFDYKVLLSAPLEVMLERVAKRSSNPYGKNEQEQAEICRNFEAIQPLLKKSTDIEIDTTVMSVNEITDLLAKLALEQVNDAQSGNWVNFCSNSSDRFNKSSGYPIGQGPK